MALEHFGVYLASSTGPIVGWTDHNPLLFLNKFKNKNQRLTRWSLMLQEWHLEIKHTKGQENVIPDKCYIYCAIRWFSFILAGVELISAL